MKKIDRNSLEEAVCKHGHIGKYILLGGLAKCEECLRARQSAYQRKKNLELLATNPNYYRDMHQKYKVRRNRYSNERYYLHKDDPDFREKAYERHRVYRSKLHNWLKDKARTSLIKAVARQGYFRSTQCESCGAVISVEGHHYDYSRYYDVLWLCKRCHERIHHTTVAAAIDTLLKNLKEHGLVPTNASDGERGTA